MAEKYHQNGNIFFVGKDSSIRKNCYNIDMALDKYAEI